jgi:Spx/MgsR family transcriptional regulator
MRTSPITVYGIRNCDTVKKARQWLTDQQVEHVFHDFKLAGVPEARLDQWLEAAGWDVLLNRKGNTWRGLDDATRASVVDASSARAVMLAHASTIKRPVVEWGGGGADAITVGFNPALWASRLA